MPYLLALQIASVAAGAVAGLAVVYAVWRSCRASDARWSDLIIDPVTGKASHTKVWSHVGYAAMTAVFVRIGWNETAGEGVATLFFVYGGIVASSQVASQILNLRAAVAGAAGAHQAPGTEVVREESRRETVTTVPAGAAPPTKKGKP